LLGLKPSGKGVTVVGDDAQSIYSFRGATVRNILDFPHQFSQPSRLVTLERNYRSTQPILEVSNAVIAQAAERHAKQLWTDKVGSSRPELVMVADEAEQARWVANRILEHREGGLALESQAVLFRTSSHSAALELELARRQIPFVKFGGLKFLEAAHVKDLLAILRFAQNPRGRMAGFRVLQLIPGIGPAHATRLLEAMDGAADPTATLESFQMPANAASEWQSFVQLYRALRQPQQAWPADMDLAKRWYGPQLERLHDDAAARHADVDNLERMASGYASRERFLSELTLDPPDATSDYSGAPHRDEDYVILSTIHSAKGQEWTSVHLLNVVDGCIPSDLGTGSQEDIEEERRLLYVAMTRAKQHLQLLVPQRFYVTQQSARGDRHLYALRTRFIADALAAQFESLVWPLADGQGSSARQPGPARIQVRESARSIWR
jgi:DNA helicase-2/ATP-dependent DNA helicase PcrA